MVWKAMAALGFGNNLLFDHANNTGAVIGVFGNLIAFPAHIKECQDKSGDPRHGREAGRVQIPVRGEVLADKGSGKHHDDGKNVKQKRSLQQGRRFHV